MQAAKHLARFTRVVLSEPTVRRHTQAAGAAYVAIQTSAPEHILRTIPVAPSAPEALVVSVDGAMVPLRQGEWAEVKTLVVGELDQTTPVPDLHALSYFSRLSDAAHFGERAVVETHRRGVQTAVHVAAVVDGAEWIQGFLDLHCPEAVRILDFAHAAEHVSQLGHAAFAPDDPALSSWLMEQLHALKHTGPEAVLGTLRQVVAQHADLTVAAEQLAYLEKRVPQMQYPDYQRAGWPIGSGVVESGNKVVVEARMKGAGMRWERTHVNPMLALRNIVYSDRWDEAWGEIATRLGQQERQAQTARRQHRHTRQPPQALPSCQAPRAGGAPAAPHAGVPPPAPPPPAAVPGVPPAPRRPAPNHPWRRAWSKRQQTAQTSGAGTARL